MRDDATLDDEMAATAATLDIPPCPAVLGRILAEVHADDPDFNRIGELISADIALSATVMKTVNSSFYGLRYPAKSIRQALQQLGLRTVASLVTAVMLRRAFPTAATAGMQRFWTESNRQAQIGSIVGPQIGVDRDTAHTYALFRLCGIPVLRMKHATFDPVIASDALLRSRPLLALERERFGVDHAAVGRRLATGWNLPAEQADAIGNAAAYASGAVDIGKAPPIEGRLAAAGYFIEALSAHLAGRPEALQNEDAVFAIDTLQLKAVDVEQLARLARAGMGES